MKTKLLKKVRRRFWIAHLYMGEDNYSLNLKKRFSGSGHCFAVLDKQNKYNASFHFTREEAFQELIQRIKHVWRDKVKKKTIYKQIWP